MFKIFALALNTCVGNRRWWPGGTRVGTLRLSLNSHVGRQAAPTAQEDFLLMSARGPTLVIIGQASPLRGPVDCVVLLLRPPTLAFGAARSQIQLANGSHGILSDADRFDGLSSRQLPDQETRTDPRRLLRSWHGGFRTSQHPFSRTGPAVLSLAAQFNR
jgi:hypothetical protein